MLSLFVAIQEAEQVAVKRVVGLPNERVEIVAGKLLIDGEPLDMPATDRDYTPPRWVRGPARWTLGPDEFFVLGDNPPLSDDGRTWSVGPGVAAQLIVGKPFIVHAPRRAWTFAGRPFNIPDVWAIRYIR